MTMHLDQFYTPMEAMLMAENARLKAQLADAQSLFNMSGMQLSAAGVVRHEDVRRPVKTGTHMLVPSASVEGRLTARGRYNVVTRFGNHPEFIQMVWHTDARHQISNHEFGSHILPTLYREFAGRFYSVNKG